RPLVTIRTADLSLFGGPTGTVPHGPVKGDSPQGRIRSPRPVSRRRLDRSARGARASSHSRDDPPSARDDPHRGPVPFRGPYGDSPPRAGQRGQSPGSDPLASASLATTPRQISARGASVVTQP